MRLADFGWLFSGVVLNAGAQLGLKVATGSTGPIDGTLRGLGEAAQQLAANLAFWIALLAYGLSVIVWVVGLSRLPVSQAYPVLSIGYVFAALVAWALLNETISFERWTGIALIIAGVSLISGSDT